MSELHPWALTTTFIKLDCHSTKGNCKKTRWLECAPATPAVGARSHTEAGEGTGGDAILLAASCWPMVLTSLAQAQAMVWEALQRDPLKGTPADANFHSQKFAPCKFP